MSFRNLAQYAEAYDTNGATYAPFYKSSLPAVGAGIWADLSMGAGTPKFNAYVGGQLECTVLTGVGNAGIFAGRAGYINRITANTNTANSVPYHLMLCDYLAFYPLVDLDSTDLQEMDNTATITRYTDGVGVQMVPVVTTPMAAAVACTVVYTNQSGIDQTVSFNLINNANIGAICSSASTQSTATSANSPFIPLAPGDTGVRKIVSVQNSGSAGGFSSFVLVRPLLQLTLLELGVPGELEPIRQMAQAPYAENGAYLNFIGLQGGSAAPTGLNGMLEIINV